jgi:hypothetical protein
LFLYLFRYFLLEDVLILTVRLFKGTQLLYSIGRQELSWKQTKEEKKQAKTQTIDRPPSRRPSTLVTNTYVTITINHKWPQTTNLSQPNYTLWRKQQLWILSLIFWKEPERQWYEILSIIWFIKWNFFYKV